MLTWIALYFGIALAMSLVLTPICRSVATRFGLTAVPKEDRWHRKPTALYGGVAIAVPVLILGATIGTREVWQLWHAAAPSRRSVLPTTTCHSSRPPS